MRKTSAIVIAASILVGCGGESTLVVDLVTDLAPREEFLRARVERLDEMGVARDDRSADAQPERNYIEGVRIAELSVAPGEHTLRVSLIDVAGRVVQRRSVRARVRGATAVTVVITRSCLGVTCPLPAGDPALTECLGGRCVDPRCSPEDVESCLPPACTEDSQCPSSGCAVGRCVANECFIVDEGACGPGRWCDPVVGCRDRIEIPDAGPPPADAGCLPRTCAELGFDCGDVTECGTQFSCGMCTLPRTCGGGGAPNRCGGNVDTTGPTVMITSGPDDPTRLTNAGFSFTGNDGTGSGVASYECSLDGQAFAACTSPALRTVGEGMHTFAVRAIDNSGNTGPAASTSWTVDRSPPALDLPAIPDYAPTTYTGIASVDFPYSCSDALTSCNTSTFTCEIDGTPVLCNSTHGWADAGGTGPFGFGQHTVRVSVEDAVGNSASETRTFTVVRCAGDMQFPNRTSNGLARGACCAGLDESNWQDFSTGYWHVRGDGSCRPPADYTSRDFETVWGGGSCRGSSRMTENWLQAVGMMGCGGFIARSICVPSLAEARLYCGTDGGSGTQTPFHGRASEGWHPAPSAGCSTGMMSSSELMARAGADNVCFNSVDRVNDRGSGRATDQCAAGLTQYCRTNPFSSEVPCVCTTADPYAADGRG